MPSPIQLTLLILRLHCALNTHALYHLCEATAKAEPRPHRFWTKSLKIRRESTFKKKFTHVHTLTNLEVASHVFREHKRLHKNSRVEIHNRKRYKGTLLSFGMAQQKQMEPEQRKAKRTFWKFEGRKRSERVGQSKKRWQKQQRQWRQHWWWYIVSANVLIVDMHVNIYIHTSLQCSILTRFPFRTGWIASLSCTMAADCHVDLEITIYVIYIYQMYIHIYYLNITTSVFPLQSHLRTSWAIFSQGTLSNPEPRNLGRNIKWRNKSWSLSRGKKSACSKLQCHLALCGSWQPRCGYGSHCDWLTLDMQQPVAWYRLSLITIDSGNWFELNPIKLNLFTVRFTKQTFVRHVFW